MSYDIYTGLLKVFPFPKEADTNAHFVYENNHPKFQELKSKYPIESIAGEGDDLSKAINLLSWVSSHVHHKGDYAGETPPNSLDLLDYAFDKNAENGINCVCLAKVLAECLLAIGLQAKQVFLMPCSPYDGDNHVVTQVYIKEMNKWIMLDPTFNAYLTNEKGEYLSLLELRNHLANQESVFFNKEANYNGDDWTDDNARENTEYFAKNLFYFVYFEINTFGHSQSPGNELILSPKGFDVKHKKLSNIEYRIKRYGDSEEMQKWLEDTIKEEIRYSSAIDFEA
jgi:hypothetical protein